MRSLPRVTALAAAVALAAGACSTGLDAGPRTERRAFAYAGKRLTIVTTYAGLRVRGGGAAGTVRVERRLSGKAAEPGNASWSLTRGTLRVDVRCSGVVLRCGDRHLVTVPDGVALTVRTTHGDVRGAGLRGDVAVTSTFGDVTLRFAAPPRRVRVTGTHGRTVVTLPRDRTRYRVRVHSRLGRVRDSVGGGRDARRRIDLTSTYGDITLTRG